MRILIEHTVTTPYRPQQVTGGTERFCHQAMLALRAAGHEADIFVTADSGKNKHTIVSPVSSTLTSVGRFKEDGTPKKTHTDLVGWYASLEEAAVNYDFVLLNSAFHSQGLFRHWKFLSKATLINHFCHTGMIEGEGGLRFQLLGRWLQQNGGRCFSSGQSNIDETTKRWENETTFNRIITSYAGGIEKVGIKYGDFDLFEGWVDVNVIPHDRAPLKKINQGKIVAVGRPVREKQIITAARAMKRLTQHGFDCHLFTSDIGEDFEAIQAMEGFTHHVNMKHGDIMKHVAEARCLLFPSKSETNGIVAFEAASHGVPVIYQCDEPSFFLEPSKLGIRFPFTRSAKGVENELCEKAIVCAGKQTLKEREKAREWFDKRYSEESLSKRLIKILPKKKR